MPNRIIKESICESEGLSYCSVFARDLYARLITYADDYGRFNADTQIMVARLYPRELDCVTQEDINSALIELAGVGKVAFYTSLPRKTVYGCFPNWKDHQRVRDSKQKCPDPDDTTVNDWYLQRFIPMDMKVEIIERDGFKCQLCGKFITSDKDAKRLVKHSCGMYHIDHIVPVAQGGRATPENLQLTCSACNLKRKRHYSFKEILQFSNGCSNSREFAATCGESQKNAALIQSESKSESNPNPNICAEPQSDSAPVAAIPLNTGEEFEITQAQVDEWTALYPAVDVMQELRNMRGWCRGNPERRKTRHGIMRFIVGWLAREQDKGGAKSRTGRKTIGMTPKPNETLADRQASAGALAKDVSWMDDFLKQQNGGCNEQTGI